MSSAVLSSGRMFIRSSALMLNADTAKKMQMRLPTRKNFSSIVKANGSKSMLRVNKSRSPDTRPNEVSRQATVILAGDFAGSTNVKKIFTIKANAND